MPRKQKGGADLAKALRVVNNELKKSRAISKSLGNMGVGMPAASGAAAVARSLGYGQTGGSDLGKTLQKVNADLRKQKTISKSLRGLSKIDYANDTVNAFRPFGLAASEVARVLGYGPGEEAVYGGSQRAQKMKAGVQLSASYGSPVRY